MERKDAVGKAGGEEEEEEEEGSDYEEGEESGEEDEEDEDEDEEDEEEEDEGERFWSNSSYKVRMATGFALAASCPPHRPSALRMRRNRRPPPCTLAHDCEGFAPCPPNASETASPRSPRPSRLQVHNKGRRSEARNDFFVPQDKLGQVHWPPLPQR
jgi:Protein involved in vacuole import and degradation